MLEGIQAKYGEGEVLADYKFTTTWSAPTCGSSSPARSGSSPVPGSRTITWSAGIQLRNSLAGTEQTALDGYLFRWWCTNGCTDTIAEVSALNRRQSPSPEEAYEWAREAVNEILGGLEGSFDAVQSTDRCRGGARSGGRRHAGPVHRARHPGPRPGSGSSPSWPILGRT